METSTIAQIKKRAGLFINQQFLQTGTVLEVRFWEPATLIEIDLHLPQVQMCSWTEVPYIKFKVADFTFRDYTPSGWDAETHTCTLFIDAANNGPGSNWAKQLKKHDTVSHLKKVGTSHQAPQGTSAIVALGDESAVSHLLALQQMVLPHTRFSGAVLLGNQNHVQQFHDFLWSPLAPLLRKDSYGHHSLIQWVLDQRYSLENTVFYLAGNNVMVSSCVNY